MISVRLSAARKARLARVAKDLAPGSTPAEAIDAAIERALARPATLPDALSDRIAELEDAFASTARDLKDRAEGRESAAHDAARASNAVLALISAASREETMGESDQTSRPRVGDWLASELDRLGQAAESTILSVRWTGTRRKGTTLAAVEADALLVAVDGRPFAKTSGFGTPVELATVDLDCQLFRSIAAHASRPFFLVCQGVGVEKRRTLFTANADGTIAGSLGDLPC